MSKSYKPDRAGNKAPGGLLDQMLNIAKAILPPKTDSATIQRTANKLQSLTKYQSIIRVLKLWIEYVDYCGNELNDSIDRALFRETILHSTVKCLKSMHPHVRKVKPLPYKAPIERPVLPDKPKTPELKLVIAKEKKAKSSSKPRKAKDL